MLLLRNELPSRPVVYDGGTIARPVWPDGVTLREAMQTPRATLCADLGLCDATVDRDRNGFPLAYTGRFAIVFRLILPGGARVALRVFTSPDTRTGGEREPRGARIARALLAARTRVGDLMPPMVHIPEAVRVGGIWYPAQVLPWAEGEPLLDFVARHREDAAALRTLTRTIDTLVARLEDAGIAHGDLQHDNMMVTQDGRHVTLVDYDALYAPELADLPPPPERGHPNYQHPRRSVLSYGVGVDRFAASVIRAGLLLLANNARLWERHGGESREGALFVASDFAAPERSAVFADALAHADHDPDLAHAIHELRTLCAAPEPTVRATAGTASAAPPAPRKMTRYPSRVTPTCDEEQTRGVSYLAPLRTAAFARQEAVHLRLTRGYLLFAPPTVVAVAVMAWGAGGPKWPFLAYLLFILVAWHLAFLYLGWGVKRQRDALELEVGKLREAARAGKERVARLSRLRKRLEATVVPEPTAGEEEAYLRNALSQCPLSRAIADAGVSANAIRTLRARGIETAAHLWQRHGFLPSGTDPEQAMILRDWLEETVNRERGRFVRSSNPVREVRETLERLAAMDTLRKARLAELDAERDRFPGDSPGAFLARCAAVASVSRSGGEVHAPR